MDAIKISQSGLDVEWQRLQVIASNLANMNSTRTATGDVVRPLHLVSGPDGEFGALLAGHSAQATPLGVRVLGIEAEADGIRRSYEPNNPDADAEGFVSYPDIDHAAEMTLMLRTSRAYEANLAAISMAQDMYARALDFGRGS